MRGWDMPDIDISGDDKEDIKNIRNSIIEINARLRAKFNEIDDFIDSRKEQDN